MSIKSMIHIEFSESEVQNILALISSAPIKGDAALTVAQLQMKLSKSLVKEPTEDKKE